MDTLTVRINSPEKLIWEGEAEYVSSKNAHGTFDILPMHANFISVVEKEAIHVKTKDTVMDYTFPHSVIYAHKNKVYIYTNM